MDKDLQEILNLVMNYVDRADSHDVDKCLIEQELQDIVYMIEGLAMRVEKGEFEVSANEKNCFIND